MRQDGKKPFYLYLRKSSGTYYAEMRDPVSGIMLPAKSTCKRSYQEAERVAWLWSLNGIPVGEKHVKPYEAAHFEELFASLKETNIGPEEAQRVLNLFKRRGLIQSASLTSPNEPLMLEWLKEFWDFDKSPYVRELLSHGHSIGTPHCRNMSGKLTNYWIPFFGEGLRRNELTREKVRKFSVYLAEFKKTQTRHGKTEAAPLSARTISDALKAGSIAYRWAVKNGLIAENPFDGLMGISRPGTTRGILSTDEVQKLFTSGKWDTESNRLASLTAAQLGLRMGELLGLRVQDIAEDRLHVRHSWSIASHILKEPKTKGSKREIPILPDLRAALIKQAEGNPNGYGPDTFIFWSLRPNRPIDDRTIRDSFVAALESIGINGEEREKRNIQFHSWRHWYSVEMDRRLSKRAAKLTGHTQDATFERYSGHLTDEDMQEMRTAAESAFSNIVPFKKASA